MPRHEKLPPCIIVKKPNLARSFFRVYKGIKGTEMTDLRNDDDSGKTETQADISAESEDAAVSAEKRIAELEKQLSEMKDRVLREMAEAENTRRRAQKDRDETVKYAIANFAKEMLSISDNFRRALDAAPGENLDPGVKNLIAGIDATERQLLVTLERFGIKKIDPLGQLFDPHFHRVMMEVDAPPSPAGTVVQVLQAGYTIHDRLLREALVAVAKGKDADTPHIDTSA